MWPGNRKCRPARILRRSLRRPRCRSGPVEQERDRHLNISEICWNAACADPVGSLLVFLNLLESQPQCFAEFLLAHAKHDAAHAHPAADIFVNRIGRFGRHFRHSLRLPGWDSEVMPRAPAPSNPARKVGKLRRISARPDWSIDGMQNANCAVDLSTGDFCVPASSRANVVNFGMQDLRSSLCSTSPKREAVQTATRIAAGMSPTRA